MKLILTASDVKACLAAQLNLDEKLINLDDKFELPLEVPTSLLASLGSVPQKQEKSVKEEEDEPKKRTRRTKAEMEAEKEKTKVTSKELDELSEEEDKEESKSESLEEFFEEEEEDESF